MLNRHRVQVEFLTTIDNNVFVKRHTEHSLVFQAYVSSTAGPEWTKMPLVLAGAKGHLAPSRNLGKGVTERQHVKAGQRLPEDRPTSKDEDVGSISERGKAGSSLAGR